MLNKEIKDVGLVLEGGGLRGTFTSGVMDFFLDNEIYFPYAIGVSAGACNGISYTSRQRGRSKTTNIEMLEKFQYVGWKTLLRKGTLIDMDLLFIDIPEKLVPFDFEGYKASSTFFEMVTTNCQTGKAEYLNEMEDKNLLTKICRASSSLPYVCKPININNKPMLDGGIVDSIPLQRAIDKGFKKNVVVLTRPKGYRKSSQNLHLPRFIYKQYPNLREALNRRNKLYNKQLKFIEEAEKEGNIVVIAPEIDLKVGRLETDTSKLKAIYDLGYSTAQKMFQNGAFNF
ncbi:MAG: patatin family protein [Paludibacteraceae bacterium]|nr:patatin family protein [Paludibacteraceae bacterium]